jgi:hypothetical protein
VYFWATLAQAHDWYPAECCNGNDCAPVESVGRLVPAGRGEPQWIVTSKHGTAKVPDNLSIRTSPDARMHACMVYDPFGDLVVICLFMPPQS